MAKPTYSMNVLSLIIFVLFCLFSFGYSNYPREFAELHINLPYLDFPVFIGEIFLFVALVYLCIKWTTEKSWGQRWKIISGIYLLWIVVKALAGYHAYGPLSFRNAALFYYPIFIAVGYETYSQRFFTQKKLIFFGLLLLALMFIYKEFAYYTVSYFLICVCIILTVKNKYLKVLFLLLLMILYPLGNFFAGGRSYLIGSCVTLTFLYFYCVFSLLRDRKMQIMITVFCIVFFVVGIKYFGNKNKIKSLLTPLKVWSDYQVVESQLQDQLKDFQFKEITPKIYHPESKNLFENFQSDPRDRYFNKIFLKKLRFLKEEVILSSKTNQDEELLNLRNQELEQLKESLIEISKDTTEKMVVKGDNYKNEIVAQGQKKINEVFRNFEKNLTVNTVDQSNIDQMKVKADQTKLNGDQTVSNTDQMAKEVIVELEQSFQDSFIEIVENRNIRVEYENMMFRIFIWRDMVEELIQEHGWFGINFGKPQRSKRIEASRMAYGEWSRDGWIAPHNSWLDYIYRGGLAGFAFIVFVFSVFIKTLKYFILNRNVVGVLLCAVIIYWFTIANFLVTFELPYNAIPVWTFLGMILAYKRDLTGISNGK